MSIRDWTLSFPLSYLQYALIVCFMITDACIMQSPPWPIRVALGILLCVSATVIPYLRRFIVPGLPVLCWAITFFSSQFLTNRPHHIFVNLLPTLERILYGSNLSELISKHQHPVLDILAWIPYGVAHYSLPFFFAAVLFVFGPPGCLDIYSKAFGWMNLAGVVTQLSFPTAPPWYEAMYGSAPANYSIHGEPGGLARVDAILGLSLYRSSFGSSPLVFGAFPSLHAAAATFTMLFLHYLKPRCLPLCVFYVMWMWWATMYLTHHFLIDVVGGSMYAFVTFFCARRYLPTVNPYFKTRLEYLGIQHVTVLAFLRSIEPTRHRRDPVDVGEEEALIESKGDDEGRYPSVVEDSSSSSDAQTCVPSVASLITSTGSKFHQLPTSMLPRPAVSLAV